MYQQDGVGKMRLNLMTFANRLWNRWNDNWKHGKIRTKRYFDRHPLWVIVGKVLDFSENWVKIEGKRIGFF